MPGCDCGCRDLHANMLSAITGRPSPVVLAQQFLRNALAGRAAVLAEQHPGERYRHLRCSERATPRWMAWKADRLRRHRRSF